jgi:enamine deaminase RidA (YjgF/YER057c/UK114 family)
MTDTIADKLAAQGIELGPAPAVAGAYAPAVQVGDLLFVSGQVAADATKGLVAKGILGADVDLDAGIAAARQCAVNVLTQIAAALGSLERVRQVAKLTVFVASAQDFTDQPKVANGASELFSLAFGDAGVHARAAVGVAALPGGSPVEVEAVVHIEGTAA